MAAKLDAKESDIQRLILDWLAAQKIWHMRLNTGAMAGVHKGKKWYVRFGKPGMADILTMLPLRVGGDGCNHPSQNGQISPELINRDFYRQIWKCGMCDGIEGPPKTVWIEVKTRTGIQSPDQKGFQQEVEAQGMKYILARSLEDVIEGLK